MHGTHGKRRREEEEAKEDNTMITQRRREPQRIAEKRKQKKPFLSRSQVQLGNTSREDNYHGMHGPHGKRRREEEEAKEDNTMITQRRREPQRTAENKINTCRLVPKLNFPPRSQVPTSFPSSTWERDENDEVYRYTRVYRKRFSLLCGPLRLSAPLRYRSPFILHPSFPCGPCIPWLTKRGIHCAD